MKRFLLTAILFCSIKIIFAQSSPQIIDFGHQGIARANYKVFGSAEAFQDEKPDKIIQLPDGKWICGYTIFNGQAAGFGLTKFNQNGTIDSSFAEQGTFLASPSGYNYLTSVVLQPDGKILVGGDAENTQIMRLTSNGIIDTSFNQKGFANYTLDTMSIFYEKDVFTKKIITVNNSIYVIGLKYFNKIHVMKLNANGTIDTTYGRNGIAYSGVLPLFMDYNKEQVIDGFFLPNGNLALFTSTNEGNSDYYIFQQFTATGITDNLFSPEGLKLIKSTAPTKIRSVIKLNNGLRIISRDEDNSFVKAYFQNGLTDSTFGTNGQTLLRLNTGNNLRVAQGHIDKDSSLITIGLNDNNYFQNAIIKLNSRGVVDSSFGSNGSVVLTNVPGGFSVAFSDASNNIQVHGIAVEGLHLTKINSNGTVNSSFGLNGTKVYPVSGSMEELHTMDVQTDGKILLGGGIFESVFKFNGYTNSDWDWLVSRLHPDGKLDTGFGMDGFVRLDVAATGRHDHVKKIISLPDNRFYVIGNDDRNFVVARYLQNGSIDNSYGDNGFVKVTSNLPAQVQNAYLQVDGKLLVTGYKGDYGSVAMTIRLNTNGTLDNNFGAEGIVYYDGNNSLRNYGRAITVLPGGNILVTGYSDPYPDLNRVLFVIKYNSSGQLDSSFGNGGITKINSRSLDIKSNDLQIQSDGKLLLTATAKSVNGYSGSGGWNRFNQTIRLHPNGDIDMSFKQSNLNTPNVIETPTTALIQKDGRILQGVFMGQTLTAIKRFKTNGEPDSSYNKKGYWQHIYDQSRNNDIYVNDGELASNNRVVIKQLNDTTILAASTIYKQLGDFTVFKLKTENHFPVDSITLLSLAPECAVKISWNTKNENYTDYFEIERGRDSITFYSIAKVNAGINSTGTAGYQLMDTSSNLSGSYFYRVRVISKLGSWMLSNVLKYTVDNSSPVKVQNLVIDSLEESGRKINRLRWQIINQKNIDSIIVERSQGSYNSFIKMAYVAINLDSTSNNYSFKDSLTTPGLAYWYRIRVIHGFCKTIVSDTLNTYTQPPSLPTPIIVGPFLNGICPSPISKKAFLKNPPLPPVQISILHNGSTVTNFNYTDSSFSYPMTSGGLNTIRVAYSNTTESKIKDSSFTNSTVSVQGMAPTQNGNTLWAPAAGNVYKWYLNGNVIAGQTGQNLVFTQDASYQYSYSSSSNPCFSILSPPINAVIPAIADSITALVIRIYPNPANEFVTISHLSKNQKYQLTLINIYGVLVKFKSKEIGEDIVLFNLDRVSDGIYILKIESLPEKKVIGIQKLIIKH